MEPSNDVHPSIFPCIITFFRQSIYYHSNYSISSIVTSLLFSLISHSELFTHLLDYSDWLDSRN